MWSFWRGFAFLTGLLSGLNRQSGRLSLKRGIIKNRLAVYFGSGRGVCSGCQRGLFFYPRLGEPRFGDRLAHFGSLELG